ncbi:MAG TPA: HAD family phosphatase [Acidobacteriota bacterium]
MIRVVIFDMGKVLVWFDNSIFFRKLANLAGLEEDRVREVAHAKLELVRALDRGELTPGEFKDRVCAALNITISYGQFYEYFNDVFTLNLAAVETARRLKTAGYKLALLSNTDSERADFIRNKFPETQVFDVKIVSYEVKLLKPEPAIFLLTLKRAGATAEECVFIDDMAVNIEAARALGITSIQFEYDKTDLEAELRHLGLVF